MTLVEPTASGRSRYNGKAAAATASVEGCQCIRRYITLQHELTPNAALIFSATTTHQM